MTNKRVDADCPPVESFVLARAGKQARVHSTHLLVHACQHLWHVSVLTGFVVDSHVFVILSSQSPRLPMLEVSSHPRGFDFKPGGQGFSVQAASAALYISKKQKLHPDQGCIRACRLPLKEQRVLLALPCHKTITHATSCHTFSRRPLLRGYAKVFSAFFPTTMTGMFFCST